MEKRAELNSYDVIDRMKKICGVRLDKELAEVVGIAPPSVHKWKSRNLVPLEPILKVAALFNVSVDWLLFGQEDNQLDTAQQMALTAFNALDPKRKIEAISFMTGLGRHEPASTTITQSAIIAGNQTIKNGD